MISVSKKDKGKVISIAANHSCPAIEMGQVTGKLSVTLGDQELISEKRMQELIRKNPFKKPNL